MVKINPITGLPEEEVKVLKSEEGATQSEVNPEGLGTVGDGVGVQAEETLGELGAGLLEGIDINGEETIEQPIIQGQDFVVDIDEEAKVDTIAIDFTEDSVVDVFSKKESDRTEEEKALIRKFNAKRAFNLSKGLDAFGNPIGGEATPTETDTSGLSAEADANIKALREASGKALAGKQEEVDIRLEQAKSDIENRGKQRMNTLDRGLSFSGFGRSSTAVQKRDELQQGINNEIRQAQAKADLEVQLFKAQQAAADSETISGIRKSLLDATTSLKETETQNAIDLAKANLELGLKGQEAMEAFLEGTAGGLEAKDKGFDQDASLALGYISDKFGNALVDDAEGNPIAFTGNEFGQDVKISQFKDANDNTYVYKNGALDSIIDLNGNILKGDELKTKKVPAQVQEDKEKEDQRKLESQLRSEFVKRPETKRFQEIRSQFARVSQGAKADSAAGDIALVFSFMKMLDPGSVVRESEFATAANAQGVPDKVRNGYNKLLSGKRFGDNEDDLATGLRGDMLQISKDLFDTELKTFNKTRDGFIDIAEDAGARPDFIFTSGEFGEDGLPDEIELDEEETTELDTLFPKNEAGESIFKSSSGKEFNINLGGNSGEPTSATNTKVSGILGDLNNKVTVVEKGGDNTVLGLSGGSLTFRTNNPLAITATGAGTAGRLTSKFNAIPDLFSPDSADNLVLNFRTVEEGLQAGIQLLESKGNLTIDKLMESHTGTSAVGHKAQAKKLGLNLNSKFKDLSEQDKLKVIEAIKIGEGFKAGTITS